jgi:hypothetical protein
LGTFDTRADLEIEAVRPLFSSNKETGEIRLTAGGPPPTGGAAGGPRAGTGGITYVDPPANTVRTMEAPSPGGSVHIYTFTSTNGTTFQINGFNNTGFSLATASSNLLTFIDSGSSGGDHQAVFAPGTAFSTQYFQGSSIVGDLSQAGSVWAALGSSGEPPLYFTGYSYTNTPALLPGDGATVTDSASSLGRGRTALWLDFETSFATGQNTNVGFLIVGQTAAVPEPSTLVLLGIGAAGLFGIARPPRVTRASAGRRGGTEMS